MSELMTFSYDYRQVRTAIIAGSPWFVAADLVELLDIERVHDAVRGLDYDEKGTEIIRTPGGDQRLTVVSEPGLYSLILRSRKPEAKKLKRWVTHEVLPQIRRTGSYATAVPQSLPEALRAYADEVEARTAVEARLREVEPLAESWEKLASASGDYSVRDAAQILCRDGSFQIGQNRLFRYLREAERPWLDQNSRPYQWAVDAGLVSEKASTFQFARTNGDLQLAPPQVRISARGVQRLHAELSKREAMVPA